MASAPRSPKATRLLLPGAVHSSFSASEAPHSNARRANVAAVAIQAPKAPSLYSRLPVAVMAAQRKQVLTVEEREQRAQAFFDGLTDPDRLADAMASLTPQAWATMSSRTWKIPLLTDSQGLDWLGCYELWHRVYARRDRGDVESDFLDSSSAALAGCPKLIYELIQDMATLGSLTKQGHALDITKEYDLMYRVFLLQDGCGYLPIYHNTVKILQNGFTPGLVRLPPPTASGVMSPLRATRPLHSAGSIRKCRKPPTRPQARSHCVQRSTLSQCASAYESS